MGTQNNTVQSDIVDAKSILNQKDLEITRIKTDIQRSHDQARLYREAIDDTKR